MEPVKIIFFDIDGTLVDHATGAISPKTKEALMRLHEKGFLLFIASGRGPACFPDFDGYPFDGFCSFNGSLCFTESETIYSNPILQKDVARIVGNAASMGRPVSVALRNRLAANGIEKDLADYYQLANLPLTVAEDFASACKEEVYQIMVGFREAEGEVLLRDTESAKLALSWERAVDVIPATSGKGIGIQKILSHFKLHPSQAMAFGDSFNDLEMLQTVGLGVAMGNAPDSVKAVAADVCGPVSEDGIYHYCIQHGFI